MATSAAALTPAFSPAPLDGKSVAIVGGSAGMGLAVAESVLRRGGSVVLISRTEAKLAAAKDSLAALDASFADRITYTAVDCENPAAVAAYFEGCAEFDHLVTTAGRAVSSGSGSINDVTVEGMLAQLAAKTTLQWACARYGNVKIRDGGSITFFTGALSRRPGRGSSSLAMANAALECLTKALAHDLGPRLRVNAISPGLSRTEAFAGMPADAQEGMFAGFGKAIPAGRAGMPTDLGEATASLLTLNWVTGAVLDVDGGAVIR